MDINNIDGIHLNV